MKSSLLDVIVTHFNPIRWQTPIGLRNNFIEHMLESGVRLTVIECAYGERPFEIEKKYPEVNYIQVRCKTLVWNKENLINLAIQRLPKDWKYVAWVDGDITFRRPHWAVETVQALQQYPIVQPWSDAYDLGPNDEHLQHHKSFVRQWWLDEPVVATGEKFWKFNHGPYDYPHPGYAWAATRQAIEWLGGLFELSGMGSADHHMALSLIGQADKSLPGNVNPSYVKHLKQWEARALHHINHNIGFVHGTIEHSFHGRKNDRQYISRWDIMTNNDFDPDIDLKRNSDGVLELTGAKPQLNHALDRYFRQRNEDVNSLT
jgi:hypothetical protein